MTPLDYPIDKQTARNYLLRGPSYTALNSALAIMQNFATFELLLWQQGSLGGTFNTVRLKIGSRCKWHTVIFYGDQLIPL